MLKKVLLFILGAVLMASLMFNLVLAQDLTDASSELSKAGGASGLGKGIDVVIGAGINAALALVGLIFMILMIYAGYLWMTAQGEEEQVKKAQKIITAAIIGLIVVVSAYAITYMVTNKFK